MRSRSTLVSSKRRRPSLGSILGQLLGGGFQIAAHEGRNALDKKYGREGKPREKAFQPSLRSKQIVDNKVRELDRKYGLDRSSSEGLVKSWSRMPREMQLEYHKAHMAAHREHCPRIEGRT